MVAIQSFKTLNFTLNAYSLLLLLLLLYRCYGDLLYREDEYYSFNNG